MLLEMESYVGRPPRREEGDALADGITISKTRKNAVWFRVKIILGFILVAVESMIDSVAWVYLDGIGCFVFVVFVVLCSVLTSNFTLWEQNLALPRYGLIHCSTKIPMKNR